MNFMCIQEDLRVIIIKWKEKVSLIRNAEVVFCNLFTLSLANQQF